MLSAYLTISSDPVTGTDQKMEAFSERITKYYNEFSSRGHKRNICTVKGHYFKVMPKVTQFSGIYNQLVDEKQSGVFDDQIIQKARTLYRSANNDTEFKHDHLWRMVKDLLKWRGQREFQASSKKKKTRINEEGDYISSNPSTPSAQSDSNSEVERRPIGQKAAKRKGKGKVVEASAGTEVILKKLDEYHAKRAEEIEKFEQWQKDTSWRDDYDIIMKDTTGMNEFQLKFHLLTRFFEWKAKVLGKGGFWNIEVTLQESLIGISDSAEFRSSRQLPDQLCIRFWGMASKQLPTSSGGSDIDERKRKRKFSNRESARRSRTRKQQHLDELIVKENQMKEENKKLRQMIDGASQLYVNFASENNVLRAQVAELSDSLRSLNSMLQIGSEMSSLVVDIPDIPDTLLEPWQLPCPIQPVSASADMFQY
ncbi:hypothetical protein BUALT_Bualt13G0000900 [Buddleja alternifolia]|uniref:BZIP domain-containing protein n=1 Tax=Buddleja alternifolia TaxID=168488 RepID=A0AAV6WRA2_9LAMI|nr:hypothetical protein BUALT_Bualt13G0000900 [Buddleja alternifolia]